MVSHMILHILHSKQKNFNGVLSLAISATGSWQSLHCQVTAAPLDTVLRARGYSWSHELRG